MAEALPGGFVDTGISRSITFSVKLKLRNLDQSVIIPYVTPDEPYYLSSWTSAYAFLELVGLDINPYLAATYTTTSGPQYIRGVFLIASWLSSPGWVQLEYEESSSHVSGDSSEYTFQVTMGPFRLGVLHEAIASPAHPDLWPNQALRYGWFVDGYTTMQISAAGHSSGTLYYRGGSPPTWLTTQDTGQDPTEWGSLGGHSVSAVTHNGSYVQAEARDWTLDGTLVDTSELDESGTVGSGGGDFDVQSSSGGGGSAAAPYQFRYRLDITRNGNSDAQARVVDAFVVPEQLTPGDQQKTPQADYLQTPFDTTYLVPIAGWERTVKIFENPIYFDIQTAWATGQDPQIRSDDRKVPVFGANALQSPAGSGGEIGTYTPVGVKIFAEINVHRPNGGRPSNWVSSDTGKITVTEGTDTVIRVSQTGANIKRTFVENWRKWVGLGPNGKSDPDFGVQKYEITRHDYYATGQDVWSWATYGWMRFTIDAPVAATLTLTVDGVLLEVSDTHTTGSDRVDDFTATEHSFSKTYTLVLAAGSNTVWVDLMFPNEGGPFYYGRVDSMTLSGFAVDASHDYTISGILLKARENGYLKCDFGPPVQRGDYSAVVLAQDGAFVLGNWPDQAQKSDEIGTYGGSVRYVDILTGSGTGTILDSLRSMENFWKDLDKVEGLEATYTATAYNAVNKDSFNVSLATEVAEWSQGITPYVRLTPGTAHQPKCCPRVRQVSIVNGREFLIRVNWPIWGAIEGQVATQNGKRAPAGVGVAAVRTDTNAEVAWDGTDASGYVVVTPIPADGSLNYRLEPM